MRTRFALVALVAVCSVGAFAAPVDELAELLRPFPERKQTDTPSTFAAGWLPAADGAGPAERAPVLLVVGADAAVEPVLRAARALAARPASRPVVIVSAAGDEPSPPTDHGVLSGDDRPVAALLVRVQHGADSPVIVSGVGSSVVWHGLIERSNVVAGLVLELREEPVADLRLTALLEQEVPAVALDFVPDAPESPRSDAARFVELLVRQVAERDPPPAWSALRVRAGSRGAAAAFTGTVPDYAAGGVGLRLGGVIPGGPAAAAGLGEGDVIVEFDGRSIADVQAYAAALETLRPGVPVAVVYLRNGERRSATIVPTARK